MLPTRHAEFRFAGILNRFLSPARRGQPVVLAFHGSPALKDPIEAIGVPHSEVGQLRVDGVTVDLAHRLVGGECVDVQPVFDPSEPRCEAAHAQADQRFVLDVHLGQLARYLRLVGIDTRYDNHANDDELLAIAMDGGRRLLTRDTGLLKRTRLRRGAFVYATEPLLQLREVVDRFGLMSRLAPFTRCARCNAPVEHVDAEQARTTVPERAAAATDVFSRCTGCARLYWRGSHPRKLKERFAAVGIAI